MTNTLNRTFMCELDRLLENFPKVSYELEKTSKHSKLHLRYGEHSRFVTMSSTTRDRRAIKNRLCDVKRTLRELINAASSAPRCDHMDPGNGA